MQDLHYNHSCKLRAYRIRGLSLRTVGRTLFLRCKATTPAIGQKAQQQIECTQLVLINGIGYWRISKHLIVLSPLEKFRLTSSIVSTELKPGNKAVSCTNSTVFIRLKYL